MGGKPNGGGRANATRHDRAWFGGKHLTAQRRGDKVSAMNTGDVVANERNEGGTAGIRSFSYWFAFTYVPPASLVGREVRVR
jgi:hypothetical protein